MVIVGAGFTGATLAERLAVQCGQKVLVVDRRPHIAGNAFDETDGNGILVQRFPISFTRTTKRYGTIFFPLPIGGSTTTACCA